MGDVRLGELGVLVHGHHGGVPAVLQRLRGRRTLPGRGDRAVRLGHDRSRLRSSPSSGPCSGRSPTTARWKKRLLAVFMAIGVTATLADGRPSSAATGCTRPSSSSSPTSASPPAWSSTTRCCRTSRAPEEIDRVSTAGYAIGFFGGGMLLLVNLAWILSPATFGLPDTVAAIKLSFVSVAVWWLVFSHPAACAACRSRRQSLEADESGRQQLRCASRSRGCGETFHELRSYRQAFLMLVAFLLYNDGIQTIIRMASIYGAEVGIDQQRADRRVRPRAVRRRAVLVPVRRRSPTASAPRRRSSSRSPCTPASACSATS